jgi:hypothetical protein
MEIQRNIVFLKKHLIYLAKHSNFFDNCIPFIENDLDDKFQNTFKNMEV